MNAFALCQDVTERKKAERAAIDNLNARSRFVVRVLS